MKKILVIEDTISLRDEIDFILKMEGFDVITTDNGKSGVEMALKHNPDLILCDVLMPGMDGFEVIQELKLKDTLSGHAFIFITALSERKNMREGMVLGADDYLIKPFTMDELLKAVNTQLNKSKSLDTRIKAQLKMIEDNYNIRMLELKRALESQQQEYNAISVSHNKLKEQLSENKTQLMMEALRSIEVNATMQQMAIRLNEELKNKELSDEIRQSFITLRNKIKRKTVVLNNSAIFQLKFDLTYPQITKILTSKYPKLIRQERLIISAMITNLDNTQLSTILNIQPSSIRKYKYRLKLKLGLGKNDDFNQFVYNLASENI